MKKVAVYTAIIFVLFFVFRSFKRQPAPAVTPVSEPVASDNDAPTPTPTPQAPAGSATDLKAAIKETADRQWSNYSIYVEDMNHDFVVDINETVVFDAASVMKIPILAALYTIAEDDPTILDRSITPQPDDIQAYGTGSIQYDPPGTSYTVKTLARLMMQKSDNTATYIITQHIVGESVVQQLIDSWGMSQTNIRTNKTSNKDISLITKRIYEGVVTGKSMTEEMLALMKDSDFEDRIPALLPEGTTVYHKIGNAAGGYHDTGIVVSPTTQYYIGIFTSDITDEGEETIARMAEISKTVYEFMNK